VAELRIQTARALKRGHAALKSGLKEAIAARLIEGAETSPTSRGRRTDRERRLLEQDALACLTSGDRSRARRSLDELRALGTPSGFAWVLWAEYYRQSGALLAAKHCMMAAESTKA
jgi:Tfp pilus assembly protein PilF